LVKIGFEDGNLIFGKFGGEINEGGEYLWGGGCFGLVFLIIFNENYIEYIYQ